MTHSIISLSAILCLAGAVILPARDTTEIRYLHPFTHETQIPVDSDLSSIRFSGIKVVKVATEVEVKWDNHYCKEESREDPGGSEFCPEVKPTALEPAYRVTYSYMGRPLASDEQDGKRFIFSIYLRPEELSDQQRQALSEGNVEAAAEYFELGASALTEKRIVINEDASTFCEGNYVDGEWTPADPKCQDQIKFQIIREPSGFLAVQLSVSQPAPATGSAI